MGFFSAGLILDPIRLNGQLTDSAVQMAVKAEYFPNQFTALPRDGDALTVADTALTWRAVETVNYNVNLYHFAYAHKRPTSNVLFWVVTVVNAPHDMPDVRLAIGSNAASVWWVNGQEVIGIYNDRQTVIDDGVSKRLTLKKGANLIRARDRQRRRCDRLLRTHSWWRRPANQGHHGGAVCASARPGLCRAVKAFACRCVSMHTMLRRFDGRLGGTRVSDGRVYAIMCPPGG